MKLDGVVKDIMTTDVITMDRYESFSYLRKVLHDQKIHHLPVVEDNKLIGMLSTTDVLRYSFGAKDVGDNQALDQYLDKHLSLDSIMQTQVVAVNEDAPIKEAAKKIFESDFNALPVVDKTQRLVGILTTKDLIKCLLADSG